MSRYRGGNRCLLISVGEPAKSVWTIWQNDESTRGQRAIAARAESTTCYARTAGVSYSQRLRVWSRAWPRLLLKGKSPAFPVFLHLEALARIAKLAYVMPSFPGCCIRTNWSFICTKVLDCGGISRSFLWFQLPVLYCSSLPGPCISFFSLRCLLNQLLMAIIRGISSNCWIRSFCITLLYMRLLHWAVFGWQLR